MRVTILRVRVGGELTVVVIVGLLVVKIGESMVVYCEKLGEPFLRHGSDLELAVRCRISIAVSSVEITDIIVIIIIAEETRRQVPVLMVLFGVLISFMFN